MPQEKRGGCEEGYVRGAPTNRECRFFQHSQLQEQAAVKRKYNKITMQISCRKHRESVGVCSEIPRLVPQKVKVKH